MSIDEMHLYLDIEKSGIVKSIHQINEFLESINLNKIEKQNNNYQLTLEKEEWNSLYSRYSVLTFEDKVDYLYIKFVANGFINLEKEKEQLDVSRSTILRCFQVIKDEFHKNGSEYEYVHGKGLKLKHVSYRERVNFCKKLIKLFVEEERLTSLLKGILNDLKKFDIAVRIPQLHSILREFGISTNYFIFSFLCSLEIYVEIFGNFELGGDKYRETEQWQKISDVIEKHGIDFKEDYKKQITNYIVVYLNEGERLDTTIKKKVNIIICELIKKLNIKKLDESLEKMLFQRTYISLFKYENNILKIKKITLTKEQEEILNILNEVLRNNSYNIYYSDKFSIIQILMRVVIEDNLDGVKNVLLLFNEVTLSDQEVFRKKLKKIVPHINFEMEATYVHKRNIIPKTKKYDLTISDEKISKDILVVDYFSSIKIQELIERRMFEIGISKI